eukprot:528958_1
MTAFTFMQYVVMVSKPILMTIIWIALSGDVYWFEGLVFMLPFSLISAVLTIYLWIYDPSLLKERFNISSPDQDEDDKPLIKYVSIIIVLNLLVIPVDAHRYEWSKPIMDLIPYYVVLKWFSFLWTFCGWYLLFGSFIYCTYLAPIVRIQTERKHKLVSDGVYSVIRHPMYSGFILLYSGGSIFCGSLCGFICSCLLLILFDLRTNVEERVLEKGLKVYISYKQKLKYRFIPYFR